MTIDSAWVKLFKEKNAGAFSTQCPIRPNVVFIDAQIKLPKAESVTTWQELVHRNFVRPVKRWFDTGAQYVVLAFDDYAHVPSSKGMTQCKRRRHIPPTVVHAHESLPPTIPGDYMELIMNRVFKSKVISLVIEFLPRLIELGADQTLIVDWNTHATHYRGGGQEPVEDETFPPLGECDCKATRYTRFGKLLIDTTDGDYIPISLIHIESMLCQAASAADGGSDPYTAMQSIPDIAIFRMECKTAAPSKRKIVTATSGTRRTYEYVHVTRLYREIRGTLLGMMSQRRTPLFGTAGGRRSSAEGDGDEATCRNTRDHEMRILALLIAFTGTDFSKGLPYISPKKIWDALDKGLWERVAECYDRKSMSLDVDHTVDGVIASLYKIYYKNHLSQNLVMSQVANQLKHHSSLSELVRSRLPTDGNARCLVKNANWLLQYWRCPPDGAYPDPMRTLQYGYTRNKKGQPVYEDESGAPVQ